MSKDKEYDALLEQLTGVVAEKTEDAIAARLNLRDAVCAFVDVERARGLPLSAVIASVKDILAKAQHGIRRASDELAKQLIDWCVEFHVSKLSPSLPPVS